MKRRNITSVIMILLICSILGMTGIFIGQNFWLNLICPVQYGNTDAFYIEACCSRIQKWMFGCISPMWYLKKTVMYSVSDAWGDVSSMDYSMAGRDESETEDNNRPEEEPVVSALSPQGVVYTVDMLKDYNYFVNQFYTIDSGTEASEGVLDAEHFFSENLSIDLNGEEPKILIYHTHSQEAYADSRPGESADTVVGVGEVLKEKLEKKYGIAVYHLTDTFDKIDGVLDRNTAYTYAEDGVRAILAENPSIKVVIDLHRDGVGDDVHLVTNINGRQTAKIMFLNGLCYSSVGGPIEYLQNEYLSDNLAFSFQLQKAAAAYYPGFTRRIYLAAYQFNLHMLPRSLLVECGAQNNTLEEAKNAMEPLADLLYNVLSGK